MTYTIGQVEEITGVKAHILRYWEDTVPGFSPQKDNVGRRYYTQRELELIFRLKYLITEKKFTTEGAGQQILDEAEIVQHNAEIIQELHAAKAELTELFFYVQSLKK
ncbi:MAG: MerR family transcriptional regulator [Treponema sp.]|nr:MerR family transcriptional regulator [Treponema sp.]